MAGSQEVSCLPEEEETLNDLAQRWLWCDDALRSQDVKGLAAASFLHHGSQDIKGLAAQTAPRSTHRTFAAAAGDSATQAAADYSGSQRDGVFRHTFACFCMDVFISSFLCTKRSREMCAEDQQRTLECILEGRDAQAHM